MARNDGVDRTTVRNQPRTESNITDAEAHNERQKACYRNEDIVPERSHMNIHFKTPSGSYQEMFRQMEQDGTISTRGLKQDAVHYGELVFDVNSAYFHNHGGYEFAQAFYAEAYRAAVDIVGGEQYILSAVMHADERNQGMSKALGYDVWHYHLHVVYVPVVEKQILWSKRCKDPALVGAVKETIMQVSHSKKWQSQPVLDEFGEPMRTKTGKIVLKKSYSVLQDRYQGWMFARLLAFSNGDLQSLYDRSNGFYRRHLILTTRERQPDRVDDPDIAEKMCCELEGIFLWAFEGLQRLVANHFRFTESARSRSNREAVKQDANNVLLFMEAGDYIRLTPEGKVGSQELYEIYTVWCRENGFSPLKNRSFSEFLIANQKKYSIEHSNNLTNLVGRRVWGFTGIKPVLRLPLRTADGWQRDCSDDNPFV